MPGARPPSLRGSSLPCSSAMRAFSARRSAPGTPGDEVHPVSDAGVEPRLELGHAPELANLAVREAWGESVHEVGRDRRAGEHDEAQRREIHAIEESRSPCTPRCGRALRTEMRRAEWRSIASARAGRRERGKEGAGRAGGERKLDRVERVEVSERRRGEDHVLPTGCRAPRCRPARWRASGGS